MAGHWLWLWFLIVELVTRWFFVRGTCYVLMLFVKLFALWFFSPWSLYLDFSAHITDFVHDFDARLFLFMVFVVQWFLFLRLFIVDFSSGWFFSSWNLHNDVFHWQTGFETWYLLVFVHKTCCILVFSSRNL